MAAQRYRFILWATVPIDDTDDLPEHDAESLQRNLTRVLRRSDADCDLELEDSERIEE